ncbi:MAG TPA: class I SAM-dependent methyltransferase [Casimicrobiaceae bacterium]|nr:class I SAM-dependent methyltransferase [Casimicrobiaceae bacterium]
MNTPSNPHFGLVPSPFIARFAHLVPSGARVLDLACGYGRHAVYFATRGARVVAVDRDAAALATLSRTAGIETRQVDLETGTWPLAGERFDAIVVSHYLHRPVFPHLRAALAADGALLYETFALGNEAFGRPTNPAFLLQPGELLTVATVGPHPMTVVAFEQGIVEIAQRPAVLQRLAAVGAGRPWPPMLDTVRAP